MISCNVSELFRQALEKIVKWEVEEMLFLKKMLQSF